MLQKSSFTLEKDNAYEYGILFFILFVYAGTFFFPLMDKDAARHANVALHMYQTGDYISLIERGEPYLDKPHFLFWSALASFKLFGVTTFADRFPHFLFALVAIYSVYRLTRHLSDKTTAKLAALILATAQSFVMAIMDARMETPLTAAIAFGLWQLILYVDKQHFKNLILAALGAAVAFSTKGWIGPIVILSTTFFYTLLQHKWAVLAKPKTWAFVPLFALFIAPELYAYYVQFDRHPELVIRGRTHLSGIRFILWGQNVERFEGNSFAEGGRNSGYFFLYHTFLWAFFPWSILAYAAVFFWLKRLFYQQKGKHPFTAFALAFAVLLILISFSRFKMPHYIIMLFPLATLMTAPYLRLVLSFKKGTRFYLPLAVFFAMLVVLLTGALNFYYFKPISVLVWLLGPLLLLLLGVLVLKKWNQKALKFVYVTATLSLVLNFFLNYNFFPTLMRYQAGNELVKTIKEDNLHIPDGKIRLLENNAHTFDFYRKYNHAFVSTDSLPLYFPVLKDNYFIMNAQQSAQLAAAGFKIAPVVSHVDYNIAMVSYTFLNPRTRAQKLDTLMLAKIYK